MGVLKLSILDEQLKEEKKEIEKMVEPSTPYHVGACDCPCWAFIRKGEQIVCEDVESAASWNID